MQWAVYTDLPMLLRELPLDGDICSRRGSMKGVNEEEDLCLDMELLSDCDWWRYRIFRKPRAQNIPNKIT